LWQEREQPKYMNPTAKQLANRQPNRLKGYDYSRPGYYYVTICTYNRQEWFGKIDKGIMRLNEYGKIVEQRYKWLSRQYPYLSMDARVTMPNHIHMILNTN